MTTAKKEAIKVFYQQFRLDQQQQNLSHIKLFWITISPELLLTKKRTRRTNAI